MPPVNHRDVSSSQPSVLTPEDLNATMMRLEDKYRAYGYRQRSENPNDLLMVAGLSPKITVLAPHAINHFDAYGRVKLADRGTGGLVELLALSQDILGIVSVGRLQGPDHQRRRNSLMTALAVNGNHPVIDLHGMSCDGLSAIDIGLGREPTDTSRSVADIAVLTGERLGLRVTRGRRFAARSEERLTNAVLAHGVPAIQVELCACLRQPCAGPKETELVLAWFEALIAAMASHIT